MAENLSIEAPDFDRIRKGDGRATENAIKLLWFVGNNEIAMRRSSVRTSRERLEGKVLTAAPTTQQDNYDAQGALVLAFNGGSAFTVTGIRATGEGRVLLIVVLGAGTVTLAHQSGSSVAEYRMVFQSGADK